ncbi:MAG: type II toxin-antitoxin system RelE/ParE family toxin [Bacteroidetes bacterium]|nr:type II toxin-antitoxin system RelE/ParE family toxin [Bacteroidota bacterium]MCB9227336.1 type II toxin-antitoxin system RelE/ParE family toxin [Chitinophagales bacterium]
MAKRKIIWTKTAVAERLAILEYWINRNKSKYFSIKLNALIQESLERLAKNPKIGRNTDFSKVRVKIVKNYLLFYKFNNEELIVLSLWDGRRHEKSLKINET